MRIFMAVAVTLAFVGVSLCASEESEGPKSVEKKSNDYDLAAEFSEISKSTGPRSSPNPNIDAESTYSKSTSRSEHSSASRPASMPGSTSEKDASPSVERAAADRPGAISSAASDLLSVTTPSPSGVGESDEGQSLASEFDVSEAKPVSATLEVNDEAFAALRSSESFGAHGVDSSKENSGDSISEMMNKSVLNDGELASTRGSNGSVALKEQGDTSSAAEKGSGESFDFNMGEDDDAKLEKAKDDKDEIKMKSGESSSVTKEENFDFSMKENNDDDASTAKEDKVKDDSDIKIESVEHDSDVKKENAEDESSVKTENVENDSLAKEENVKSDTPTKEEDKNDSLLKTKNDDTEEFLENLDTSMLSAELENMDHVKISEDLSVTKTGEENKNNATPKPQPEEVMSDTVMMDNLKSTTASINRVSAPVTKATDKLEENKSTTTAKTDVPSSTSTDAKVNIDGNQSTSTEADVSVSSSVLEKSSENMVTVPDTDVTTNNASKDQTNLLHVTTEPLTNRMTSEQNVVTEAANNSTVVSTLAVKKYNYLVSKDKDVSCILASMAIVLKIPYATIDKKIAMKTIQMPSSVTVSGECADKLSSMTFTWTENTVFKNNVTFHVTRDEKSFYVSGIHVHVYLDEDNFPNAAESIMTGSSAVDSRLFSASIKDGIHVCHSVTEVQCGKIGVMIKDISLIAYNDKQDVFYRREELCTPANKLQTATIIGSVVGVVVILAIVILLAWFKSRSNNFRSELP